MNWLAGKTIALSISAPEDMPQHGLGPEHFNDAMGEITRQLLALGARVMYGGDLRAGGITRMLFELAARYSPPSAHVTERTPSIINVIPYYAHAEMAAQDLDAWEAEYSEIGALLFMSPEMNRAWTRRERPNDLAPTPSERWPDSLTAMRTYVTEASDARIVVGGKSPSVKPVGNVSSSWCASKRKSPSVPAFRWIATWRSVMGKNFERPCVELPEEFPK